METIEMGISTNKGKYMLSGECVSIRFRYRSQFNPTALVCTNSSFLELHTRHRTNNDEI